MSTIFNGIPSDFYVYVNAHLKNYIFDCASVYIHICIYIYIYIYACCPIECYGIDIYLENDVEASE